jgi:branched-chain amino acid aminotransferase
MYGCD